MISSSQPQTTNTRWLNSQFFPAKIQLPLPNNFLAFEYKGLVFCGNNGWLMENMDKEPTVPKWVLINQRKIPQTPQKFAAKFVCPSPKVWDFQKKLILDVRSLWSQRSEWANAAKKATTTPLETLHDGVKYFPKSSDIRRRPQQFDKISKYFWRHLVQKNWGDSEHRTSTYYCISTKNILSYNNRKIEEIYIPRKGKSIKMRIIL